MVAEIVYSRPANARRSRSDQYATEKEKFLSGSLANMYQRPVSRHSIDQSDSETDDLDVRNVFREIEHLATSNMPWKERKQLENEKVVSLGGKPVKKHRTPLSVAKAAMKNQKKREQKRKEEDLILGRFTRNSSRSGKKQKSKPEGRGLRASEGHFRKGVLNVKHMLAPAAPSKSNVLSEQKIGNVERKGKGKKNGKNKKQRKGR